MIYKDTRSNVQRVRDSVTETLDDISNVVLDNKELTVEEAAELIMAEWDAWRTYYKERYEFYENLKNALKQRIS